MGHSTYNTLKGNLKPPLPGHRDCLIHHNPFRGKIELKEGANLNAIIIASGVIGKID